MIVRSVLITSLLSFSIIEALNETQRCRKDLGMYSGDIKDSVITASSSYDEKSVGPLNARIRTERNGGAWCPKNLISRDVHEWIQIDLEHLHYISQVETQGRFGNGQGQEYAPNYMLEYQRYAEGQWIRYKDIKGSEILKGNSNTYLAELRELYPPIIARAVRFIPYSSHPRTVCMRVELYGCVWADGVISYSMNQGERRGGSGGELDFSDHTYDGHQNSSGYLSGGLGQLTDGQLGGVQFRLDLQSSGKRGFEWVAWKRENQMVDDFIEIIFTFDSVRNFSKIRIHTNNIWSKDIGVFKFARVHVSVGGHFYTQEPVVYEHERDMQAEEARYTEIPMDYRLGRHVRVQLYFDTRWIMISEVHFDSVVVTEEVPAEIEPTTTTITQSQAVRILPLHKVTIGRIREAHSTQDQASIAQNTIPAAGDHQYADSGYISPSIARSHRDPIIGILLGSFAALFIISSLIAMLLLMRHRRKKFPNPLKSMFADDQVKFSLNCRSSGGKIINGNVYNSISACDYQESSKDTQPSAGTGTLENFTEEISLYSTMDDISGADKLMSNPTMILSQLESFTARPTDRVTTVTGELPNTPGSSVKSIVADCNMKSQRHVEPIRRISLDQLRFLLKLGEGSFGEVYICEALDLSSTVDKRLNKNQCCSQTNRGAMLVAVRKLYERPTEKQRRSFEREVEVQSCLKDDNISQVLGVCKTDQLCAIVSEYSPLGNLRQFLSRRFLECNSTQMRSSPNYPLSHGCLIYLATQIASGMRYLESLGVIHRDLSCRNCLVGHRFIVKISDLGTSSIMYPGDYHSADESGTLIPLRWMSWEAALLNKFSSKSDVWSFGVTLWEIMSFAQSRPFNELTNQEVLQNLGHCSTNQREACSLVQPIGCSREVYDLMVECWRAEVSSRPTFHEIHMFLSRKNSGYSPRIERLTCCAAGASCNERV